MELFLTSELGHSPNRSVQTLMTKAEERIPPRLNHTPIKTHVGFHWFFLVSILRLEF